MSEVGTVRREEHDGGYSIWVLVHRALVEGYGSREHVWCNPEWLCIESTTVENCGKRLPEGEMDGRDCPVIGAVPGTAAANAAEPLDSRAVASPKRALGQSGTSTSEES
jgi:hypothetical protein